MLRHLCDSHMESVGGQESDRNRLDPVLADQHTHVVRSRHVVQPMRGNTKHRLLSTRMNINAAIHYVSDYFDPGSDPLRFEQLQSDGFGRLAFQMFDSDA